MGKRTERPVRLFLDAVHPGDGLEHRVHPSRAGPVGRRLSVRNVRHWSASRRWAIRPVRLVCVDHLAVARHDEPMGVGVQLIAAIVAVQFLLFASGIDHLALHHPRVLPAVPFPVRVWHGLLLCADLYTRGSRLWDEAPPDRRPALGRRLGRDDRDRDSHWLVLGGQFVRMGGHRNAAVLHAALHWRAEVYHNCRVLQCGFFFKFGRTACT